VVNIAKTSLTSPQHIMIDQVGTAQLQHRQWHLPELKEIVNKWQNFRRADGFWNSVYIQVARYPFGTLYTLTGAQNHDNAWSVSRFGNDSQEWRARSAKLLAMLEITQGGTLFVYQGEELGMKNSPKSWGIDEYKDAATINYYNRYVIRWLV
jgi:oligo-1,6-glucosidase